VPPLRILHISTRLILGGSQENTVLSCEGQARLGHEVHLAFGPIYGPEGSLLGRAQAFRTPDGRGIATHTVPHLVRQIAPRSDVAAQRELKKLIRRIRPDIVHTHSSKAGILGRFAAWDVHKGSRGCPGRRIGIVHTIHGPPFMPLDGPPPRRLKTLALNHAYTLAERRAARHGHIIVSVADAMTSQFLKRRIGRPEQYATVYSGMEVERYLVAAPGESRADMRAALGLSDGDFVVGTVARLAEHKGHDDLLDALGAELAQNRRLKFLWVGDGWWRDRLLRKARGMGLVVREMDREARRDGASSRPSAVPPPPQLLIAGLVPSERIAAYMRAMDALAHPSYREGLPRTIPQALLCGVSPIAYDVDGTGEVCRDMQTGRLVPLASRERLREAILWTMNHPRERAALADRGREECRVRFSAERMVESLEAVYGRALHLAGGGS
jgi:glycosyltransferase involved in cell wall biosynthesis